MAFVASGGATLLGVEIDAEQFSSLDPRHDAGNVVEIHIPPGAEAVKRLLQPRGAGFAERRDDDVRVARAIRADRLHYVFHAKHAALVGAELLHASRAPQFSLDHSRSPRPTAALVWGLNYGRQRPLPSRR